MEQKDEERIEKQEKKRKKMQKHRNKVRRESKCKKGARDWKKRKKCTRKAILNTALARKTPTLGIEFPRRL